MNKLHCAIMIFAIACLYSTAIYAQDIEQKPDGFMINAKIGLLAYESLVEAHLSGIVHALDALAMTEEVRSGNWKKMHLLLREFQTNEILGGVWYVENDGTYYYTDRGKEPQSLKNREYFAKVMHGQKAVGDLVISRTTGKKVLLIAVPVLKEKKVVAGLGVSVCLEKLCELIAKQISLPPNTVFYALNQEGKTALHSNPELLFELPTQMHSTTMTEAIDKMMAINDGYVEYIYNGKSKKVIFTTSELTGWKFAFGTEEAITATEPSE